MTFVSMIFCPLLNRCGFLSAFDFLIQEVFVKIRFCLGDHSGMYNNKLEAPEVGQRKINGLGFLYPIY